MDEHILRAARKRAEAHGATLSGYIADALRARLATEEGKAAHRPFKLITFGTLGPQPGIDLDRTSALLEADDVERYRRGQRR